MKKVMSIIFVAMIVANVFLSTTPVLTKKSTISFSIPLAVADGENEPPKDEDPVPDGIIWIIIKSILFP